MNFNDNFIEIPFNRVVVKLSQLKRILKVLDSIRKDEPYKIREVTQLAPLFPELDSSTFSIKVAELQIRGLLRIVKDSEGYLSFYVFKEKEE